MQAAGNVLDIHSAGPLNTSHSNISAGQANSSQLYNSAIQGLSNHTNNIMMGGHPINQNIAHTSLLDSQVISYVFIYKTFKK